MIKNIKDTSDPFSGLSSLLDLLHESGPESPKILEELSYYKEFHPLVFRELEERIVSALGLFYKIKEPQNLYSYLISGIGEQHKKDYGQYLTPVQASVRRAVEHHRLVSISAPTSAGKSYSLRDFIAEQHGDAVIIVPSRALIAEYLDAMKRKFKGDKRVMISSFVDSVFLKRAPRRIFVLTPERARDLFLADQKLNVQVFFFDEAQMSEEKGRGVVFDVLVRRVHKHFPTAKIIFAHPFVENPQAQLKKHHFPEKGTYARAYTYGSVGKLCIQQHANNKSYYFSPFLENGHQITNCIEFPKKFSEFAFNGQHSVLVYVSKRSIYNGKFLDDFQRYVDEFPEIEDSEAVDIINTVEHLLGANEQGHRSILVTLLKKGVVIHHGSVPLEVRFLIEDFIRNRYARICFATSTLAQGVNMPFDIVWLENMRFLGDSEGSKSLAFKNLIGRSGRLSDENAFDYGYVYTKNPKLFSRHINSGFRLREESVIDAPIDEDDPDSAELITAIRDDTYDEDKQIPKSKVERLSQSEIIEIGKRVLDIIYAPGISIKESISGAGKKDSRIELLACLRLIFESSLGRSLHEGESAVFDQAVRIFLQMIQGRTFREIVGSRYSYVSRREERRTGVARFSQPASKLPNASLVKSFSVFDAGTRAKDVSYDTMVFDTYDYFDQVISFSLSDVFVAAFKIHKEHTFDARSNKMIELLRFGTNNALHVLLMRYGLPPEGIAEISPYIASISESDIIFKKEIEEAPAYIRDLVEWYRP